jgi:hypothetical protein
MQRLTNEERATYRRGFRLVVSAVVFCFVLVAYRAYRLRIESEKLHQILPNVFANMVDASTPMIQRAVEECLDAGPDNEFCNSLLSRDRPSRAGPEGEVPR